jgi:hypothetical protein
VKRLLPAAVCLVLGFGLGWLARAPDKSTAARPPAQQGSTAARSPPKAIRTANVAAAPPADLEALRAENALLRKVNEGLETEVYGVSPAWPPDAPRSHREDFEPNLRAALADCDVDVDLVAVDCAEPPCTAIFRHAEDEFWNKLINTCPGWVDRYGSSVGSSSGTVECGDGRSESVWRISPGGWEAPEPEGAPERNTMLRMQARWDEMEADWTCSPP